MYLKQNVLFPKGLNWVQHWVSLFGSIVYFPGKLDFLALMGTRRE